MKEIAENAENRIITIPNTFSLLRILLIPEFIWLYSIGERAMALIVLALSVLSDVLDGDAARRLGQVSRLGRVLDPLADKLTQLAVAFCLVSEHPVIGSLAVFLLIKEGLAGAAGLYLITHGGEPFDSRWFGKLSTTVLYLFGIALLFGLPDNIAVWLMIPAFISLSVSFVLYAVEYADRIGEARISQMQK